MTLVTRTPIGSFSFISDPMYFDSKTRILSWKDTYVLGCDSLRMKLISGSIDLSAFGNGTPIIYFDTVNKIILAKSATTEASEYWVFLGILWLYDLSRSILNFKLLVDGKMLERINAPFYQQVWDVMGDSITNFNEYQPVVNQIIGFNKINNYGVGGTCLSSTGNDDTTSMSYRIKNIDFTADLITVFGGTNDWGNIPAKPLGQFGDTSDTTVYGAIYSIINTVLTNAPTARLAFITPLQRDFTNTSSTTLHGWSGDTVNELGYMLEDVVNAIKEVCGKYGIPVLDLYHTSGITKFNLPQMTRDGLHPNTDLGMVKIGKQIAAFIKTL